MPHAILTCINHPHLRWSCKDIAISNGIYIGARSIFFDGTPSGKGMFSDGSGLDCTYAPECSCSAASLILAPEDCLVVGRGTIQPLTP